MSARILRIELRRSIAPWATLLIAGIGVFVLFASNPPYQSWMELAITQRDILQLTWPLALAAGAWQGMRERRSGVEELMATTSRPRWQRVLPVAAAMAIAALVTYLVMLAGAAGHLRYLDGYFPTGAIPVIAVGVLSLVAAAWLGVALGSLLPSPLTAPMLVVVGFLALALVPPVIFDHERGRPGTALLFPSLQGPRDGAVAAQMLSTRANLTQGLWLAALAVTGLAVYAAARRRTRVAAVVPVLLGAVIAVPAMPDWIADAWVEDRRATELVCTSGEPRICLERRLTHVVDDLREPAGQALAILAAKLPPAPTQVLLQDPNQQPTGPQPADTLLVAGAELADQPPDVLLAIMLDGAGVWPCENIVGPDKPRPVPDGQAADPVARYFAARSAVAAWLLDREPRPMLAPIDDPDASFALAGQALAALRALPVDEQRARIAAFRDAERACAEGDRLELLTGASGTR